MNEPDLSSGEYDDNEIFNAADGLHSNNDKRQSVERYNQDVEKKRYADYILKGGIAKDYIPLVEGVMNYDGNGWVVLMNKLKDTT